MKTVHEVNLQQSNLISRLRMHKEHRCHDDTNEMHFFSPGDGSIVEPGQKTHQDIAAEGQIVAEHDMSVQKMGYAQEIQC